MTDITEQKPVSANVNQINENDLDKTNDIIVNNDAPETSTTTQENIWTTTAQENTWGVTPSIKITVQWSDWTTIWSFAAKKWETIMALAQANNVEIPFSCGAWACGLCLCYIVKWWEFINKEYTTPSFMQLEEDQVLTCIAAVKDECFDDENVNVEIVLKRAY